MRLRVQPAARLFSTDVVRSLAGSMTRQLIVRRPVNQDVVSGYRSHKSVFGLTFDLPTLAASTDRQS